MFYGHEHTSKYDAKKNYYYYYKILLPNKLWNKSTILQFYSFCFANEYQKRI